MAGLLTYAASARGASTFSFPPTNVGTVAVSAIDEASGLVASRNNSNVLWTHNDSGDTNRIFALSTTGQLLGTYTLPGATNTDWEDIAIGPGPEPGVEYLYITNASNGSNVRITRIAEPSVYAAQQAGSPLNKNVPGAESQTFNITAPDVESMFVDPLNGDFYLGSKELSGTSGTNFFRGTQSQFGTAGTQTLSLVANSSWIARANGASITPDGSQIFVRNQNQFAFLFDRTPGETIAQTMVKVPQWIEVNGKSVEANAEAIAFDAYGNNFYTFSEGVNQKLYKYTRTSNDGPAIPTTLVAAASDWKYLDGGAARDANWNQPGASDGSWATGSGPFGFGQGNEQTVLSFGGNASSKAVSYEFRNSFEVDSILVATDLTLKLLVDDGAAVFFNGTEITRFNLGVGAADNDLALAPLTDSLQNTWRTYSIDPSLLLGGTNTLAIEVHTSSLSDIDLRFDAQLIGNLTNHPGDLNGDGFIGQDDLNLILGNWGENVTPGNSLLGDPSQDGFVGQDDLNLVLGGWGRGNAPVPIPEPSSLVLMGLAAIGMVIHRIRRPARHAKSQSMS
ncbi:MAG: PEP-CTERM sorting domain-containing protein [Planctomycetota bacterium]|nr:PEP-CTERM sorting domain-containing protein [Planctomycetota bacterium]